MDEDAWVSHWLKLSEEILFLGPSAMKLRPKPSEDHLNQLEGILTIPLPYSYRAFVKVFGPGRLAQSVDLFAPGYKGAHVIDFLGNNRWQEDEAGRRRNPEQIRRLVSFANLNYQDFVWDTQEVTHSDSFEYRIYYLPRELECSLIEISDSFSQFIEDFCLTGEYWRLLGSEPQVTWEDEETGETQSIKCFFPIGEKLTSRV